jgi:hypothetical protein
MLKAALVLALLAALTLPALKPQPAEARTVLYTFTVTELGQGQHGSVALFDDFTVRGRLAVSLANGAVVVHLIPQFWEPFPGEEVIVCFIFRVIMAPSDFPPLPPLLCAVPPLSGTPIHVDNDGDGKTDLISRLTKVGN